MAKNKKEKVDENIRCKDCAHYKAGEFGMYGDSDTKGWCKCTGGNVVKAKTRACFKFVTEIVKKFKRKV